MSNSKLTKLNVPSASLCIHIPDNVMCKKRKKTNYKESGGRERKRKTGLHNTLRDKRRVAFVLGGMLFDTYLSCSRLRRGGRSSPRARRRNSERMESVFSLPLDHEMSVFDVKDRGKALWVDGIYLTIKRDTCRHTWSLCQNKTNPENNLLLRLSSIYNFLPLPLVLAPQNRTEHKYLDMHIFLW